VNKALSRICSLKVPGYG